MNRRPAWPLWGWTGPVGGVLARGVVLAVIVMLLTAPSGRRGGTPPPPLRVDPNTAPEMVLMALPRIGPARAAAIIEARQRTTLRSPDDLDREARGFGPATVRAVEPYLRFDADPGEPGGSR